jgi:riboflavin synthase
VDFPGWVGFGPCPGSLSCVFTGIVRQVGEVVAVEDDAGGLRLAVDAPIVAFDADLGDSVAISGVCLTVVAVDRNLVSFQVVPETIATTTLGGLRPGARVNVEPALRGVDQLGGHFVQGHVDGVGSVRAVEPEGSGRRMWVDAPAGLLRHVVEKGSVAVEGTSLTVADLDDEGFAVALIPHTLSETTLGELGPGDPVNLETDVLAKYVERLLQR